jgi:dipeptidyl-peptidase-3
MRQGSGTLLAELMRIKAEGDYEAIKALVNKYGVRFNPALRDQVVARFKKLDMPTYWAGVNPKLKLSGTKVEMSYPEDPVEQYLRYGSMYDEGLAKQNQESVSTSGGRMQMSGRLR